VGSLVYLECVTVELAEGSCRKIFKIFLFIYIAHVYLILYTFNIRQLISTILDMDDSGKMGAKRKEWRRLENSLEVCTLLKNIWFFFGESWYRLWCCWGLVKTKRNFSAPESLSFSTIVSLRQASLFHDRTR